MNRQERRRKRTRESLVEATQSLLIEEGYEALTVLMITERADVARATFYVHFNDKEEAIWAVLSRSMQSFIARTAEAAAYEDEDRMSKWVAIFEYTVEQADLYRVVLSDRGHVRLRQGVARVMYSTLLSDLETGRVPRTTDCPTEIEATFYSGGLLDLMVWWLERDPRPTPAEMAGYLGQLVWGKRGPQRSPELPAGTG